MFIGNANILFNQGNNNCLIICGMHEQMTRLYQAAKELRNTEGQTEVAKLMDALPQTLNNWETRGISDPGLLKAQQVIGCDAIWLRDGTGDMVRGGENRAYDLSDVARLVTLYGQSTEYGRRLILDFARDVPKVATSQHDQYARPK